jgi:hypothetical protein
MNAKKNSKKPEATTTDSPEIQLVKALIAFQTEVETLKKDGTNDVFSSAYVTLPAVKEAIKPLLKKHQLAVVQLPTIAADGRSALRTIIMHAAGASIEDTMLLLVAQQNAQAQGSAITYGRRYALMSALGIVAADEDDDGNAGSGKSAPAKTIPKGTGDAPTDDQLRALTNLCRALGATDEQYSKTMALANSKLNAAQLINHYKQKLTNADASTEPTAFEEPPANEPPVVDEQLADGPLLIDGTPDVSHQVVLERLTNLWLTTKGREEFIAWAICKPVDSVMTNEDWAALDQAITDVQGGIKSIKDEWRAPRSEELDRQATELLAPPPELGPPKLTDEEKFEIKDMLNEMNLTPSGLAKFIKRACGGNKRFLAKLDDGDFRTLNEAIDRVMQGEENIPPDWYVGYVEPSGKDKAVGS